MDEFLSSVLARCRTIVTASGPSVVADLDRALTDVAVLHDPACIVPLLSLLEDEPPYDEAMFSIVHTIETFDDSTYVRELLSGTAVLLRASRRWADILYMRILNSDPARSQLVRQLRASDTAVRDLAIGVLQRIASIGKPVSRHAREALAAFR